MVTPAPFPYQQAAWRFLGRFALVAYYDAGLAPGELGSCFTLNGRPVIQIRPGLSFGLSLQVLLHELIHCAIGGLPDYRRNLWGEWRVYSGGRAHAFIEPFVYRLEAALYDDISRRSAQLPGWLCLKNGAGAVVPGLRARLEAQTLAMIGAKRHELTR